MSRTKPAAPAADERRNSPAQRPLRFRARVSSLVLDHRRNGRDSLHRLVATPLQTAMAVIVIALALALPTAFFVGIATIGQLGEHFRSSAQISVFLVHGTDGSALKSVLARVRALPGVIDVTYLSPNNALEEFKTTSGFGDALALLDENPLPPVLLVRPDGPMEKDPGRLQALVDKISGDSLVDAVQFDMKWLQRMQGLLDIGRQVAFSLGLALAVGVVLVVGNTIGLAIESRRDEVLVVKLVGGTSAFVRRPFLYTGLWLGTLGGVVAWLGLELGRSWLAGTVARLGSLYESQFALADLGFWGLALPVVGAAMGLLGGWLGVARHLAQIEPG